MRTGPGRAIGVPHFGGTGQNDRFEQQRIGGKFVRLSIADHLRQDARLSSDVKAALAARPKLRYSPGTASRLRLLRRFAPASMVDAAIRKYLRLAV